MNRHSWKPLCIALIVLLVSAGSAAYAGSTAFTYQGFLTIGGTAANGNYDFKFSVWDAATEGNMLGEDPVSGVDVKNGVFTVVLNEDNEFTEEFYYFDDKLYLEIDVWEQTAWQTLEPRQRITPAPFAGTSSGVSNPIWWVPPQDHGVVNVQLATAFGMPGVFSISNEQNTEDALSVSTVGNGDALAAMSSGNGLALRAAATGAGRAGLFEITDLGNGNNALEVTTAGSGSAVRASAASGVGLLAESGSGVGLRASSATGTSLDVTGTSVFSGTASFNAATPFSVASSTLIPNLNSGLLDGQASSFYRNASNLNAGTLNDARLSTNVALLDAPQTFTVPKTFSAPTTFNARVVAIAGAPQPTLVAANTGAGLAAELEGNVHVTGELTRAYAVGTSNLAAPIAYGSVNSDGMLTSGTPNVSSMWDGTRYLITIDGENYTTESCVTTVTPVVFAGLPSVASTQAEAGDLTVHTYTLQGAQVQRAFHFVVYKP